jgi:hypothetical protein
LPISHTEGGRNHRGILIEWRREIGRDIAPTVPQKEDNMDDMLTHGVGELTDQGMERAVWATTRYQSVAPAFIQYLYDQSILERGKPFACSRWGTRITPMWIDTNLSQRPMYSAIHETSHAVLAMTHGLDVQYVQIAPETHTCRRSGHIPDAYRHIPPALINSLVSAGGPIGASLFVSKNPTTWVWDDGGDFLELCFAECFSSEHMMGKLILDSIKRIADNWKVIVAIAEHLQTYKRVRYPQCIRIAKKIDKDFPRIEYLSRDEFHFNVDWEHRAA